MMELRHNKRKKRKNNNLPCGNPRLMRLSKQKNSLSMSRILKNNFILKEREILGAILEWNN